MKRSIIQFIILVTVTTDPYKDLDYDEINSYELKKATEFKIKVYKPCKSSCPNESISQGYGEPDPVREEPVRVQTKMYYCYLCNPPRYARY